MNWGTVGRVALGVGIVGASGALLAACGDKDDDEIKYTPPRSDSPGGAGGGGTRSAAPTRPAAPRPQETAAAFVKDEFAAFDKNRQGGITKGEITRTRRGSEIVGERQWTNAGGGVRHWKQRYGYVRQTVSMRDAFAAARNLGTKDQRATWQELAKLAARFDKDGRPGLSAAEQRAFNGRFAVDVIKRENVWVGWDRGTVRPTPPRRDPPRTSPGDDYQPPRHNPPTYHPPHTSPGDDYVPPRHDPPRTSPGDDHGGSGGTSRGDDPSPGYGGGTSRGDDPPRYDPPRYDPPPRNDPPRYDPPSYDPPSSGGNSSDNGNPSEDDF